LIGAPPLHDFKSLPDNDLGFTLGIGYLIWYCRLRRNGISWGLFEGSLLQAVDGSGPEGTGGFQMVRKEKSAAVAFLESAEKVEWVEVVLADGRRYEGNVIRNPIRRTGTIVNALDETRIDFAIDDVAAVRRTIDPRTAGLS